MGGFFYVSKSIFTAGNSKSGMKLALSNQYLQVTAFTLVMVGLFSGLGVLELRAEEPRRALVAMEMWIRGDWILPTLHGQPYYNKPPVFNWILLSFFKIFGTADEWVVRLPGLLSFLVSGGLIFSFLKNRLDKQWAFLAMLAYWTSVDLFFYGSVNAGEIDLFFSLLIFGQALWLFVFFEKRSWLLMFSGFYLLGAVAFLTKGLPAVLFTGFTLVAWMVWKGVWKPLFSWQHLLGLVTGLFPVMLYAWAYAEKGDISPYLVALVKDATRKSGAVSSLDSIMLHVFMFPLELIKLLLPWSLLLVFLFFKRKALVKARVPSFLPFLLVFIVANIWVYWVSPDTRNRYLYPFFPVFIMLLAWSGYTLYRTKIRFALWVVVLLACGRLAYNVAGMPYQQEVSDNLIYRNHSRNILEYTDGEPVYLLGLPFCESQGDNPLAMYYGIDSICNPPLIPFQLPYYISGQTSAIMKYKKVPVKGDYYLSEKAFAEQYKPKVLYAFRENWIKNELVLFKYGE